MAFLIGSISFALMMTALLIAGKLQWGGAAAKDEPNNYCEAPRGGMIKQPSNTWSDLGFVLAGLGILAYLSLRGDTSEKNPMVVATFFSVLYGCLVIWLGPGSMFLHASLKVWGAWLDNLSMNMFVAFFIAYDVMRATQAPLWVFLVIYLVLVVGLGILTWFVEWGPLGIVTFLGLIVLATVGEVLVANADHLRREVTWLIIGLVHFGVAFLFWFFSRTGKPMCKPHSLGQGHAVWHILSALATVYFYLYLHSEKVLGSAS